ncbi:MAG: ATP-dependent DNA ligase [Candidatus Altiarchaeota archaeon]|nr:ATP-dependent DNA ligase [Candidatus Altiarchaeota archaeon]
MDSMPFSVVAEYFQKLESTSSRLQMTEFLVELFKKTPGEEIDKVAYLCLGHFAPEYEDIVLGIGDKTMIHAISMASHRMPSEVTARFKEIGDLGSTAESMMGSGKGFSLASFTGQDTGQLTVNEVFVSLRKIANASGKKSQDVKIKTLAGLLSKAKPLEARYIVRIGLETLRLGTGAMTLLDALATLYAREKKNRPIIENAYNISSDIGLVARELATGGLKGVERIKPIVGRPIKMMAAQRVQRLEEIPEKMEKFAVEEKYDGERVQIHKDGAEINIFSRRLENITAQYPDVIGLVKRGIKADKVILEGEVVAVKGNRLQPFQILMQRKRKYDIDEYVKRIPIRVFLFDLLFFEKESYLKKPYTERRKKLEGIVKESKDLTFARRIVSNDLDEIRGFFDEGLKHGTEGIMAKSMSYDSIYRAGAREWLWIKWKKDYLEGLVDTFDLVLVGAFMGTGKRAGVYGTVLGAVYNADKDMFETFCKVGTGFTDEILEDMPGRFKEFVAREKPARVRAHRDMKPDVWFEPAVVMEISGAEITESPLHTCASDELGKGLSLRFPRFKQFREKKPEDATSTEEVIQMYEK